MSVDDAFRVEVRPGRVPHSERPGSGAPPANPAALAFLERAKGRQATAQEAESAVAQALGAGIIAKDLVVIRPTSFDLEQEADKLALDLFGTADVEQIEAGDFPAHLRASVFALYRRMVADKDLASENRLEAYHVLVIGYCNAKTDAAAAALHKAPVALDGDDQKPV